MSEPVTKLLADDMWNDDVPTDAGRMQKYGQNVLILTDAFNRYGNTSVSGEITESLRESAIKAMFEIVRALGTDRLPISDFYAVVPNYYARRWHTEIFYHVGFEMVIRDFRNFEELCGRMLEGDNLYRYVDHPTGKKVPIGKPNAKARTFDIPIGMIRDIKINTRENMATIRVDRPSASTHMILSFKIHLKQEIIDRFEGNDLFEGFINDLKEEEDEHAETTAGYGREAEGFVLGKETGTAPQSGQCDDIGEEGHREGSGGEGDGEELEGDGFPFIEDDIGVEERIQDTDEGSSEEDQDYI